MSAALVRAIQLALNLMKRVLGGWSLPRRLRRDSSGAAWPRHRGHCLRSLERFTSTETTATHLKGQSLPRRLSQRFSSSESHEARLGGRSPLRRLSQRFSGSESHDARFGGWSLPRRLRRGSSRVAWNRLNSLC
jgi:hypothetical protein